MKTKKKDLSEKKLNKNKRMLLKLVVIILFIIGLILLFWNMIRATLFYNYITAKTYRYETVLPKKEQKVETIDVPSLTTVYKEKINDQSTDSLGRVRIPSVGIDTAILYDITNYNLSIGSAMMFPKRHPETDNMVILSHHYYMEELLFGRLGEVKKGEIIYLDYLGYRYEYIISNIKVVHETDTSSLENDKQSPVLTLITCDSPDYTDKRTVVTAKLKRKNYSNLVKQVDTQGKEIKEFKELQKFEETISQKITKNYSLISIMIIVMLIGIILILVLL